MNPSVIGKAIRQAEVERQLLEENLVRVGGPTYIGAISRELLTGQERQEMYTRVDDQNASGDKRDAELEAALGPSWYENLQGVYATITKWSQVSPSTSEKIYGICGLDFGSYWVDPEPVYLGLCRAYNSQLFAHSDILDNVAPMGNFHGVAVKELSLHKTLDVWEDRATQLRADHAKEYALDFGPCPPIGEMLGLIKGFETVCADNEVRRVTTTSVVGYDAFHDSKAEREGTQTVTQHNSFIGSLKSVTTEEAQGLLNEGVMILWNPGNCGKNYVVDVGTQEVL